MNIQRFSMLMLTIALIVGFAYSASYADAAWPSTSAQLLVSDADDADEDDDDMTQLIPDTNNGTSQLVDIGVGESLLSEIVIPTFTLTITDTIFSDDAGGRRIVLTADDTISTTVSPQAQTASNTSCFVDAIVPTNGLQTHLGSGGIDIDRLNINASQNNWASILYSEALPPTLPAGATPSEKELLFAVNSGVVGSSVGIYMLDQTGTEVPIGSFDVNGSPPTSYTLPEPDSLDIRLRHLNASTSVTLVNSSNNGNSDQLRARVRHYFTLNQVEQLLLDSPNDGQIVIGDHVALSWQPFDVMDHISSYVLELARLSEDGQSWQSYALVEIPSAMQSVTFDQLSQLGFELPNDGTIYAWHMKAESDCAGVQGAWSEVRAFGRLPEPLGTPTLISPIDEACVAGTDVTFQWSGSPVANRHRIQFALEPTFSTVDELVLSESATGIVTVPLTSFPNDGTRFYWRVDYGLNQVFTGEFSDVGSFVNQPSCEPTVDFLNTTYTVDESSELGIIVVALDAVYSETVTVDYATSDDTATAGDDYTPNSGTLTFYPGSQFEAFGVVVADDALDEGSETISMTLSNATNAIIGGNNPHTLTIIDDDAALPSFESTHVFGPGFDGSQSVVIGDMNGDGALDIVVGNDLDEENENGYAAQNVVYFNNGHGNFDSQAHAFGTGSDFTSSVAVGDINGDGALDVVAGNTGQPNALYLNDGEGNFNWLGSERLLGTGSDNTTSVRVGDMNNDGALDIVVGNLGEPNVVYFNDGNANFDWPGAAHDFGTASDSTWSIGVAKINSDDFLDIVVGNVNESNVVYLNDGAGNFNTSQNFGTGEDGTFSISIGDMNGDEALDLVVGNGLQDNVVYLNSGTGQFYSGEVNCAIPPENVRCFGTGDDSTWDVEVGDVDGDGDLDIAVDNLPGSTGKLHLIYLNDGNGHFLFSQDFGTGSDFTLSLAIGDMNQDGALDIVAGNFNDKNVIYFNHKALKISPQDAHFFGLSTETASVAVGDMDADGDLDIVSGNLDGPDAIYLNNGAGDFDWLGNIRHFGPSSEFTSTMSVAVGDVNGNGALDIVVGDFTGQNVVYLNDSLGHFYAGAVDCTALPENVRCFGSGSDLTRSVALGDVNGDGALDIVVGNFGGQNAVYLNDGVGNFDSAYDLDSSPNITTGSVALGDVNGDSALDIVVGNVLSQSIIYLNDGVGHFDTVRYFGSSLDSMFSVALADLNRDGFLDLVVGNWQQQNAVYLNDGAGNFDWPGTVRHFGLGSDATSSVSVADMNGDGALDLVVGNQGEQNAIYQNEGGGDFLNFRRHNFGALDLTASVAVGDMNADGSVDLIVGNVDQQSMVYLNRSRLAEGLPNNAPYLTVTRPGSTANANFYSTPEILDSRIIPITYTLSDPDGDPVGRVAPYYSLNGGGEWHLATATSNTISINLATNEQTYIFYWDTFADGLFGRWDNVVFGIEAYPLRPHSQITDSYRYTNTVSGPYQWPNAVATTFPFRVRGTQVQVYSDTIALGHEVANALVYRLPAGQTVGALPLAADDGQPFTTDAQGYLQGHGQLEIDDRLIALLPITATSSYTLYHTSAVPTVTGLDTFTVTTPGVQELVVSADNPLILFDLDVSLEWDARNDYAFLEQLESDIKRTSQFLYDWTNGQVALGKVRLYHAKEKWLNSHVIIPASNNLRPSADLGGIVNRPLSDILSNTQVITDAYLPGQVRMAPIWNRFGNIDDELGLDWSRTLAHELSHYLLFLPDNYLGLSQEGLLADVDCQGSAMTDPYRDDYSEFLTSDEWTDDCLHTLGEHTTGRADWDTITTFYEMFSGSTINPGPGNLPLNVTQVTVVEPETPANTLADPFFYLTDEDGIQLELPIGQGQGYLFKTQGTEDITDDVVMPIGVPFAEQLHARGAEPGDRLCVFDYSQSPSRLGCLEAITQGSTNLALHEVSDWQPKIRVDSVTSVTLAITVTQSMLSGELYVQILPAAQPITTVQTLSPFAAMIPIGSDTFTQTITLDYPIANGFVRVWISDTLPLLREEMSEFYFSGGWGPSTAGDGWGPSTAGDGWGPSTAGDGWGPPNRYGWGISRRHGWMAPVTARDGQVTILDLEHIFGPTPIYTLQSLSTPPNLPPWLTPVGQAYRFSAAEAVTSSLTIMFDYLQREVPGGPQDDQRLRIYYSPNEGLSWQRLEQTQLDTHHNHASAPMPGEGIYALMSTIEMPPFEPEWNNFGYPVAQTRPITTALASIDGYYTVVGNYNASLPQPWRFYYPTVEPEFAPLVNDLTHLEFGRAYWLHATEEITLYLGVSDSGEGNRSPSSNIQLPPATFYGWITPSASFMPTVGMTVTARIDGNVCGQSTIVELDGQLAYKLAVMAENVLGPPNGCGASGQNIVFEVGDWVMGHDHIWDNSQAWFHSLEEASPLAVTLASFSATGQVLNVLVEWQTVSELDNLGFNLWRGTSPDRPSEQLNPSLIPSQAPGSGQGSAYQWQDNHLVAGTTTYYWLEDINTSGVTTRHGPISVTLQPPAAIALMDMQATPAKDLTWQTLLAGGWLLFTVAGWLQHHRQRG